MLNGYPTKLHKDARIHEIPCNWELARIGEVCKVRNNLRKPLSAEERRNMQGPYPYYGPTSQVDSISEYRLDGTYALIGEDGDHFLKYDRMSMTQLIKGKSNVNNHAHIIEGTPSCSTEWVFNFFRHRNIYHFLSRQGAGRYKLNKNALLQLPLLVPPVPEQHKIAAILSTWDRAIDITEKLIAAMKKRKRALMQQLLTGKVRFAEFGTTPWKEVKLGELLTVRNEQIENDGTHPLYSLTIENGVTPKTERYNREFLVKDKASKKYKIVYPGDVVFNPSNLRWGAIGIHNGAEPVLVSPIYEVLYVTDEETTDKAFLFQQLSSSRQVRLFSGMAEGTLVERTAVKLPTFMICKVLVPPTTDEQSWVAGVFAAADLEIQVISQRRTALKQQKKGLMQMLLTGKVRVNIDAEKNTAIGGQLDE